MNTQRDSARLHEALKWYESCARQALCAVVSFDAEAIREVMSTLAADAGQCGMRARALNGDSSDAGVGA